MPVVPFLRDSPNHDPAIQERIADLRARLESTDDSSQQMVLFGQVGDLYRAAGAYDQAVIMLENALAMAQQVGNERRIVANLLRLATTRQYDGEHAIAVALFHDAIARTNNPDCQDYVDFAWQHLGKCLVEQGQLTAAIRCFDEARRLRLAKGDAALLASTESALAAVQDRLRDQSASMR